MTRFQALHAKDPYVPPVWGSGPVGHDQWRLSRGGKFIDEGILNTGTSTAMAVSGGGVTMGYGFSSPGPGRGAYDIAKYGLHLNYSNGKAPDSLFFLEAGESKDNRSIFKLRPTPPWQDLSFMLLPSYALDKGWAFAEIGRDA